MPQVVAFFPWVYLDEPLEVADVRLIPYVRGKLPGNSASALQSDLDAVLSAYALRPGAQVERAVLLEVGEWRTGQETSSEQVTALFKARDEITFAALSRRMLFRRAFSYCGADNYRLTVQRYHSGSADSFAYTTRRRDGASSNMWSSEYFAFYCPLHVYVVRAEIDVKILAALRRATIENISEAIVDFNAANTDASEIPEHAEMVMAKCALEWLYGVDENWLSLWKALQNALRSLPIPSRVPHLEGADESPWKKRWGDRPLLEAWVKDFCLTRNEAAHGSGRDGKQVWTAHKHLMFASLAIPLLVKLELQVKGLLEMDPRDMHRLAQLDAYISHDPYKKTKEDEDDYLWSELESHAMFRSIEAKYSTS